jgi:hypothetical protein
VDDWSFSRTLSAVTSPTFLGWVLVAGFAVLAIALLILISTRWGQANPLRKCIVLSLVAHLLLACYSTTAQITSPSGPREIAVRIGSLESVAPTGAAQGADEASPDSFAGEADDPWESFVAETPHEAATDIVSPDRLLAAAPEVARSDVELPEMSPLAESAAVPLAEFNAAAPADVAVPEADVAAAGPAEADAIEAPAAMRRADADAGPKSPGLTPVVAPPADAEPVRSAAAANAGLPAELLQQPTLAPQLADLPALDGPGESLLDGDGAPDKIGGPARLVPVQDDAYAGSGTEGGSDDASGTAGTRRPGGGTGDLVRRGSQSDDAPDANTEVAAAGPAAPRLLPFRPPMIDGEEVPELYSDRVAPDRSQAAQARGGTPEAEESVQAALHWLAENQEPDGRWDARKHGAGQEGRVFGRDRRSAGANADTAVTGLALLAFLGAGHTHLDGDYRETVRRGLDFLLASQGDDGNLEGRAELYARMYSHGMATCALSEAYGLTRDSRLLAPLRAALAYTLAAQHPDNGGWRYKAGDPIGDTSQLGWQLMALKSAELAGIDIPERSRQGMLRFLRSVAGGRRGGLASYRPGEQVSRVMTAEALVCRHFLGTSRDSPASDEAGDYLMAELPGEGQVNFYYWYYGTLATYHLQGEHWEQWNVALQEALISAQVPEGDLTGSWDPDPVWGSHGGRVYSTALGALCLEVYYRYLPLYAEGTRPVRR